MLDLTLAVFSMHSVIVLTGLVVIITSIMAVSVNTNHMVMVNIRICVTFPVGKEAVMT